MRPRHGGCRSRVAASRSSRQPRCRVLAAPWPRRAPTRAVAAPDPAGRRPLPPLKIPYPSGTHPRSAALVRCGPRPALASPRKSQFVEKAETASRNCDQCVSFLHKLWFSPGQSSSRPAPQRRPPSRVRRTCCVPSRRLQIACRRFAFLAATGAPALRSFASARSHPRRRCSRPRRPPF